jgi:hypothetical protein
MVQRSTPSNKQTSRQATESKKKLCIGLQVLSGGIIIFTPHCCVFWDETADAVYSRKSAVFPKIPPSPREDKSFLPFFQEKRATSQQLDARPQKSTILNVLFFEFFHIFIY